MHVVAAYASAVLLRRARPRELQLVVGEYEGLEISAAAALSNLT